MIELTPLDVRKKQGDFARTFRGYDPQEVETFLDVVADRFEDLVKENLRLQERTERLEERLTSLQDRESAVHEALVTAQELREEVSRQARREAELLRQEAEVEVNRLLHEAERKLKTRKERLEELERQRLRFLRSFRTLLERNLDAVEVEESRSPLEEIPLEIEFSVGEMKEEVRERVKSGEGEDPGEVGGVAEADDAETDEGDEVIDVRRLAPEGYGAGDGQGADAPPSEEERREAEGDEGQADDALWLPALEDEGSDEGKGARG